MGSETLHSMTPILYLPHRTAAIALSAGRPLIIIRQPDASTLNTSPSEVATKTPRPSTPVIKSLTAQRRAMFDLQIPDLKNRQRLVDFVHLPSRNSRRYQSERVARYKVLFTAATNYSIEEYIGNGFAVKLLDKSHRHFSIAGGNSRCARNHRLSTGLTASGILRCNILSSLRGLRSARWSHC